MILPGWDARRVPAGEFHRGGAVRRALHVVQLAGLVLLAGVIAAVCLLLLILTFAPGQ